MAKKLSISVPDEVADSIQRIVSDGHADSVSAFLTTAAVNELDRSSMTRVVIESMRERARAKNPERFEASRRKVDGWFGIERA